LGEYNSKSISTKNSILVVHEKEYNFFAKNINEDQIIKFKPPVNIFTFIENLNVKFIQKKYQDQSNVNVKDFFLDINSRELKKGKLSLKLTERETDMILFLNKSKKPVNVETLEKEIWQHSSELETHTVETHIYRLRKKIKAEFGNDDLIKSNKNGYTI
jgi:DNA-binding response OmpR family regulator